MYQSDLRSASPQLQTQGQGGAQPGAQQQGGQPGSPPNPPWVAPPGMGQLGYVNPAYTDPKQNEAYMKQYEQLIAKQLQPEFQQQNEQLQDSSAARGISSSGAGGYLQSNLLGEQAGALAGAQAPIVQQGYGYTQQDIMGNQAAANAASYYNAGTYNNQQNALESAYLNSFGPNTGVTNAFGQAVGGVGQTVGGVYESQLGSQGQELGGLGGALGEFAGGAGGGAAAGAGAYGSQIGAVGLGAAF